MSLRTRLKARVWSRVLGRPWVVVPVVLGLGALAVKGLMGINSAWVDWQVVLGLGLGGYQALRMVVAEGPMLEEQEREKLGRELASDKRASLSELRDALELAEDYAAVQDVQTLEKQLDRFARGQAGQGFTVPEDFCGGLEQLGESCIASLRKAVRLGAVGRELSTPEARSEVETLRAGLLTDVHEAIGQFGVALDRLQVRAVRDDPGDEELPRLRDELDTQLEVARRVESRLEELEHRLAPVGERGG